VIEKHFFLLNIPRREAILDAGHTAADKKLIREGTRKTARIKPTNSASDLNTQ
jgi:hypothetical protein